MDDKWIANPGPQEKALSTKAFELLYGGSRGGGKTDAGLVWMLKPIENPRYRGLVIRRNADDLSDWIGRARIMYKRYGADFAYRPTEIRFPTGALIKTGHLKDDQAYTKYQGHEYQRILIEELTQIPDETRYLQLIASCRSTVVGLDARVFSTTNPGGIGHAWVKRRFVDHHPWGEKFIGEDTKRSRIFIPAKVEDTPQLIQNDPGYLDFLDGLKKTNIELWKAWRLGDWDTFAGQVFQEWRREKHVVTSFDYPVELCYKQISFDWGYNDAGCAIWLAFTPDQRVYQYRELYQKQKNPREWAKELKIFLNVEKVREVVLPHDCFSHLGGYETIATVFEEEWKDLGENRPFIVRGNTQGKDAVKNRLAITHQYLSDAPDGLPYLQIGQNCLNTIRTLPQLVYSDSDIETIHEGGEDHAYDALSLGLVRHVELVISSGAVKPEGPGIKYPRTFVSDDQGNIQGPDFWKALKEGKKRKSTAGVEFGK